MKRTIIVLIFFTAIIGISPYVIYLQHVQKFKPISVASISPKGKVPEKWDTLYLQNYRLVFPSRDTNYIFVPFLDLLYPVNKSVGIKILDKSRKDLFTLTIDSVRPLDVGVPEIHPLLNKISSARDWMVELGEEKLLYNIFQADIEYVRDDSIMGKLQSLYNMVIKNDYVDLINNTYTLELRQKMIPREFERVEFMSDAGRTIAIFGNKNTETWNILKGGNVYTLKVEFSEGDPLINEIKGNMLAVLDFIDSAEVKSRISKIRSTYDSLPPTVKDGQPGIALLYSVWSINPVESGEMAAQIVRYLRSRRLLTRGNYWFNLAAK